MFFIRQGSTIKVVIGPAVAVGDGFTPVTTLDLSTADEAEAILHDNGTVVDISAYTFAAITTADGYYHLTLQSGISGTVGHVTVIINDDSLILPLRADFTVLEEAVYDAWFAASAPGYVANAPVNVAQISADSTAADNLEAALDGTGGVTITAALTGNVTGNLSGSVGSVTAGVSLADDAITAGKFDQSTAFPLASSDGSDLTEAGGTGDHLTAINLPNQTMDIIGNITGNLSGSVGSVTGNVSGNVVGNVGGVGTGAITTASFALGAIDAAAIAANAITAAKIAPDAIGASELAADAITEIQNGLATSANQTTILNRLGAWTGSARNTILGAFQALFRSDADATVPSDVNADLGGGVGGAVNTTDSTQAIRDNQQTAAAAALTAYDALVPADLPANFAALGINASGHVSRVTLVDTTTTNSDMRGTDAAATAANLAALQTSVDDVPNNAEFEARTLLAAAYFDPAADAVANVTTVGDVTTKEGYKLASDGLDSISTTAPSGVAANFREMLVQTWRRFFKKSTLTSTQLKTYADNGTDVLTTQTVSDDGTTQTQGDAS